MSRSFISVAVSFSGMNKEALKEAVDKFCKHQWEIAKAETCSFAVCRDIHTGKYEAQALFTMLVENKEES